MKSVFPDKEVFNNYTLNTITNDNTSLEFTLTQYPNYIFSIDAKLKNRIVKVEREQIVKENRIKEYCTIIVDSASKGNIDIEKLTTEFPYMEVTNKMIKGLNSEIVLEYKNPLYDQITRDMAISLLEMSMFGIVDESIFTIISDKKELISIDYLTQKEQEENEEKEENDELE